jgi:hypothetical protein
MNIHSVTPAGVASAIAFATTWLAAFSCTTTIASHINKVKKSK